MTVTKKLAELLDVKLGDEVSVEVHESDREPQKLSSKPAYEPQMLLCNRPTQPRMVQANWQSLWSSNIPRNKYVLGFVL